MIAVCVCVWVRFDITDMYILCFRMFWPTFGSRPFVLSGELLLDGYVAAVSKGVKIASTATVPYSSWNYCVSVSGQICMIIQYIAVKYRSCHCSKYLHTDSLLSLIKHLTDVSYDVTRGHLSGYTKQLARYIKHHSFMTTDWISDRGKRKCICSSLERSEPSRAGGIFVLWLILRVIILVLYLFHH